MASDVDRLRSKLAQDEARLRQLGWTIKWGRQPSHNRVFLHARKPGSGITDEILITAKLSPTGSSVQRKRYILPRISKVWYRCNETSLWGFAERGASGIIKEGTKRQLAICDCGKFTHVSASRAIRAAQEIMAKYSTTALQRHYRCARNIRAFHLTSHVHGRPIPGAYIDFSKMKEE